jgi:hypothetical protein
VSKAEIKEKKLGSSKAKCYNCSKKGYIVRNCTNRAKL